jgi:hypothetical protein
MPKKMPTKMPTVNDPDFYGALGEFNEALEIETERLETLEKVVGDLLDLLVLTGKKVAKLQKTYEGDPTPDIFPNEEGGS